MNLCLLFAIGLCVGFTLGTLIIGLLSMSKKSSRLEDDAERWARLREEAIEALNTAVSRLTELDDTESISYLEIVLDNLQQGMED